MKTGDDRQSHSARRTAGASAATLGRAALLRALVPRLLAFAVLGLLAYPPVSLSPLIFIAFVPYIDAVRITEQVARGPHGRFASFVLYLGGSLFFFGMLHWLMFLPTEQVTVPGIIILATVVGALYLGLYAHAAQWAARRATRLGVPLAVAMPVAWVAGEYLRTQSELGCPWGLFGYALTPMPLLLQTASWIGVFGVSLIVALVAGLVFAAWRAGSMRQRVVRAAAALGVVAALLVHGVVVLATAPAVDTIRVAMIQGNIGRDIKFKPEFRVQNMRTMVALSDIAVSGSEPDGTPPAAELLVTPSDLAPELVIWPETAAPCRLKLDLGCQMMLREFTDRTGVPTFTGFPALELEGEGEDQIVRRWNSSALIMPGVGITGQYHKTNLVPFGEAIPYQERLPILKRIDFGEADFTRGPGFEPVRFAVADFGVMICYESIFPAAGRVAALRGAEFFINITNDEWFGRSAGPYQHAAMAVGRSIECRRGLARCANTGITFAVDRFGRMTPPTPLFERRIVETEIDLGRDTTLYMRIGDLVAILCLVAMVGAAVVGGWRRPGPR